MLSLLLTMRNILFFDDVSYNFYLYKQHIISTGFQLSDSIFRYEMCRVRTHTFGLQGFWISVCIKKVCCLPRKEYTVNRFLSNVINIYATALAIEVLYICTERAFGFLHWNVILYVTSFMSEYFLYNLWKIIVFNPITYIGFYSHIQ